MGLIRKLPEATNMMIQLERLIEVSAITQNVENIF